MPSTDRPARPHRRACAAVLALMLAVLPAHADSLAAHEILYRFSFKGINAGDLQLTLKPDGSPDSWVYETRAFPGFLASLVVNANSRERSWFQVTAAGVQANRYFIDDGTSDRKDDSDLTYDWARGRVTGLARGEPLDIAIEPGLQDTMSIRAAVLVDLLAGREPHEYAMLDGREIKHYVYTRRGTARLKTALGEVDTVIYSSDRKGADGHGRIWWFWYAPSLHWLPVRAEQRVDGQARMTLAVRSLKWLATAAATPAPTGG